MTKGIGFNEILEMLIKHNPTKKPEFLRDELIGGILSGEIKMTDTSSLTEFYRWCKNYVDENKEATSPLNWINLFLYSSMADESKHIELPGLNPIIQSVKKAKVGHKFDFVLHPHFLKGKFLKKIQEEKSSFLALNGTLRFKDEEFYFLLKNNYKIMMKFCWIITKETVQ